MENGASIETLYGGGNHGHLGLIINPDRYIQEAGQHFVIPPRPPTTPTLPRQFMLQVEMDAIRQNHKAAITRYYTALNVNKTLKKQLTKAVHPMYTSALQVPLMGFTNVSAVAIIQHLYHNYD
eukprot:748323-Ditylum_brightwellii.AAC.2